MTFLKQFMVKKLDIFSFNMFKVMKVSVLSKYFRVLSDIGLTEF